jgi:hypothetical protein
MASSSKIRAVVDTHGVPVDPALTVLNLSEPERL